MNKPFTLISELLCDFQRLHCIRQHQYTIYTFRGDKGNLSAVGETFLKALDDTLAAFSNPEPVEITKECRDITRFRVGQAIGNKHPVSKQCIRLSISQILLPDTLSSFGRWGNLTVLKNFFSLSDSYVFEKAKTPNFSAYF